MLDSNHIQSQTEKTTTIASRSEHISANSRPLSPHLTIYKPQLTSILSILHRFTGMALATGGLLICYWLLTVMAGPEYFEYATQLMNSWLGRTLLVAWSWATIYHLLNGVRHLCWDLGLGLSIKNTYHSGRLVFISSIIFTFLLWSTANV